MKVVIDFGDEIMPAIQQHLDGGKSVARYVQSSVAFMNDMLALEAKGNAIGYGDKSRFHNYNTVKSPKSYLDGTQIDF